MARRIGILVFKSGADRFQDTIAQIRAIIEAFGESGGNETPPDGGDYPKGHLASELTADGLIWTPEGTPSREVSDAIIEAWPKPLWTDAARVSYLESNHWSRTAERNTLDRANGICNVPIGTIRGHTIYSEDSVGLFQVNVCSWPYTRTQMLDAKQNARAGYEIYRKQGWGAWLITAETLGLV